MSEVWTILHVYGPDAPTLTHFLRETAPDGLDTESFDAAGPHLHSLRYFGNPEIDLSSLTKRCRAMVWMYHIFSRWEDYEYEQVWSHGVLLYELRWELGWFSLAVGAQTYSARVDAEDADELVRRVHRVRANVAESMGAAGVMIPRASHPMDSMGWSVDHNTGAWGEGRRTSVCSLFGSCHSQVVWLPLVPEQGLFGPWMGWEDEASTWVLETHEHEVWVQDAWAEYLEDL